MKATLRHMIDPGAPAAQREFVHAVQEGGQKTLCGLLSVNYEIEGATYPRLIETKRNIACLACRKAVEMATRNQLRHLSVEGLEKVLALVDTMRNGDLVE